MPLNRRVFLQMTTLTSLAVLSAPNVLAGRSAESVYSGSIAIDGMGFPGGRQQGEQSILNALEFATHLTHKAGYTKASAHTGAVTLIQRFGSALNLNIHFHMLFLNGVYVDRTHGSRTQ